MGKQGLAGLVVGSTCIVFLAAGAHAQLIVNPAGKAPVGRTEAGATVGIMSTDYEYDVSGGSSFDVTVDRTILGAYVAYGISDQVDVYGSAYYALSTELEISGGDWPEEGSGFGVAGGARGLFREDGPLAYLGYVQIQLISEDYGKVEYEYYGGNESEEISAEGLEALLGVGAAYQVAMDTEVYGFIDLAPFSTFEAESEWTDSWSSPYGSYTEKNVEKADAARDSMIGLRAGGIYRRNALVFRGEISLVGETGFTFSGGGTF